MFSFHTISRVRSVDYYTCNMKYELPTTWDQKVQIRMYNHLKDKFIKYLRYMFKKNNYFLVNYLKKKRKILQGL